MPVQCPYIHFNAKISATFMAGHKCADCAAGNLIVGKMWVGRQMGLKNSPDFIRGTKMDDNDHVGECWHDFSALYDSELVRCQLAIEIKQDNPENPWSDQDEVHKYLDYSLEKLKQMQKLISHAADVASEICAVHFVRNNYREW
ncbi:MAG: hypothetical protein LBO08_01035 [Rickettsiales bacterium]|nr:hypothetical protein [Rickettsiales bacterium]